MWYRSDGVKSMINRAVNFGTLVKVAFGKKKSHSIVSQTHFELLVF